MTRLDFMVSAQRALLGVITPNVRSVSGSLGEKSIAIRYVIDGEIGELTRQELSCASTLVVADLKHDEWDWAFEEEFIRLDAPLTLRETALPLLFYQRYEAPAAE